MLEIMKRFIHKVPAAKPEDVGCLSEAVCRHKIAHDDLMGEVKAFRSQLDSDDRREGYDRRRTKRHKDLSCQSK